MLVFHQEPQAARMQACTRCKSYRARVLARCLSKPT